ncbi:MAG: class I SAM-dependent methyltransferase [Pseudomonadota bacterium]|nr:class I SAM-dependent methyltransferase [Pseudomonadota bacterium]
MTNSPDLFSLDHSSDPLSEYSFDPMRTFDEGIEAIEALVPLTERTRTNLDRALQCIEDSKRSDFIARHREKLPKFDRLGPTKYADFSYWAFRNVLLAQWLDLDRSSRSLDILDIGMGSGSFAMVARSMGHRVVGTDREDPWYDELCRLAGVRRIDSPVIPNEPYRPVAGRFDLITIMLPVFHRRTVGGRREYWSVNQWQAFLADLAANLAQPEARIFIYMPLDKHDDGSLSYSPLVQWAQGRGAIIDRTFPESPLRHILFANIGTETFASRADAALD